MEQLTQSLKNGAMQLMEVPYPALVPGCLLVRNHYSVISPGTEGKTVKDARLGYIGKARARKEEVKKVITSAKTFGVLKTYEMVMNKLENYATLGYSCAGEVIGLADDVTEFKLGDFVACGGNGAVHSEVVAIPQNLCVKVNESLSLKEAAFTTIGAIALQGVRQSELKLGESCLVIGLGLIGQLTLQLLNAAGVKAIGIDIDSRQVELAKKLGCSLVFERNNSNLESIIAYETNGYGTDAVIITASTNSLDPIELAGETCRKKGKVIVVGAIPTGFSRKNYFKKELDLRMSSSYGPGRYDTNYEEKGLDYPIGYVRWTENRNMQAFVDLLETKKINIAPLITHEFAFSNAAKAYQLILDKADTFGGITLAYDIQKELVRNVERKSLNTSTDEVKIGLIGAGSFAQNFLLPTLKTQPCHLVGIATARSNNARYIADKYDFNFCAADASELIQSDKINTVFIATRHNTHAQYVLEALQTNKHVFVEKPLCLNEVDLEKIKETYSQNKGKIMIGFNRRFAPFVLKLQQFLNDDLPKAITYRINAGQVPLDHWVHDPEVGGGRIIGEACHFIDLTQCIAKSPITSVSANALKTPSGLLDSVTIHLTFKNGSIATVSYFSNGSKQVSKEYLEVFSGKKTAILNDFKELTLFDNRQKKYTANQDKGYALEIASFLKSITSGEEAPIPFNELYLSSLATLKVIESIQKNGEKITLS